ncbi:hypothetical protein FQN54_005439 [Arachnomyces sp. PD_36]|nr:hypothetical protein FQN54_005439 [Arachnomyces sp. PD_36]
MSKRYPDDIVRDGFASAHDRFMALPGGLDRVEGHRLRSMFLPKISPAGQRALRDNSDFVRCQLKHYGVEFEERELTGNGTALLKAALQAGKCDRVPDYILELEKQMHAEWISKLTPEQLCSDPQWAMQKYFLSDGEPDRTKTTTVVGIPFDKYSSYSSERMVDAAGKIAGLHHVKVFGPETQVIFMGWDREAVEKRAKEYPVEERKRVQDEEDERENEREEMHRDLLKSRRRRGNPKDVSPVGSYIVDCEEIESNWPDMAADLTLDIHRTYTPGVFKVEFDFGVLEGVMIICSERSTLDEYCAQADRDPEPDWDDDDDSDDDDDEDEDEDGLPVKQYSNNAGTKPTAKPKKQKASHQAQHPLKYQLKLRCRETDEGMIYSDASTGTITFKAKSFATFKGVADFPVVGEGVPFFARKVSDKPAWSGSKWADYSEEQNEMARVN